ncbi:MAG: glycoside hydrolase family 5 protein [Muribaculaceae bacterium]|nr:glycoside hydrolase family 5 protein [Muribaculaceae bacterium]
MKRFILSLSAVLAIGTSLNAADFENAQSAVNNFRIGWNLGNTLDSNSGDPQNMWIEAWTDATPTDFETAWGQPVATRELIHMFKMAGFNAIRVPVTWYPHMGNTVALCKVTPPTWDVSKWEGYEVDPAWMARVREVVNYVIDEDMYCILNVHHDTGAENAAWLIADPEVYEKQKARFESLWTQIATEFRDYDQRLVFQGYNEMLDKYDSWCFATYNTSSKYIKADAEAAYDAINKFAQSFVNAVRATGGNNAQRNLIVNTYGSCNGSGTWNQHLDEPLINLKRPTDTATDHIIFDVHSYFDVANLNSAKKDVDAVISDVNKYLKPKGAPVIFSEWGTTSDIDKYRTNLCEYAHYYTQKSKASDITMFYWMVLSDAADRSVPKWSTPDVVDAIVKGYYGDGGYNAIENVICDPASDESSPVYNLQGIKVEGNLAPGVYIRGGKKFLVR